MSVWFLLSIFRIIIPVTVSYQNNNKCVCSRIFHCLHPSSQTCPEVIMLELHWHIIPMETELGVINMALWLLSRRRQMGFWHWICKIYLKTQMSKRIAPRQKRKKKKKKKKGYRAVPIIYLAYFLLFMFFKDLITYGRTWFCLFFFVVFGKACSQLGLPDSSAGKDPPAMQETLVLFLGQEDPLENG